jgi:hypothetical protein
VAKKCKIGKIKKHPPKHFLNGKTRAVKYTTTNMATSVMFFAVANISVAAQFHKISL